MPALRTGARPVPDVDGGHLLLTGVCTLNGNAREAFGQGAQVLRVQHHLERAEVLLQMGELGRPRDGHCASALRLLTNAANFTPPGGEIILRAFADDEWVAFEVSDNGPGIPQDRLDYVFELFAQLDTPVEVSAQGGLGIGLALVRRVAELHGGSVTAESRAGEREVHGRLPRHE